MLIKNWMSSPVVTIVPGANTPMAQKLMNEKNKLVGIISPSDLSRAFLVLTAYDRKGIQLGLQVEDRPGIAIEIADCIRNLGGRISSLISTDNRVPDGYRQVYLRIYGLDRWKLDDLLGQIPSVPVIFHCLPADNPALKHQRLRPVFVEKSGTSVITLKQNIRSLF